MFPPRDLSGHTDVQFRFGLRSRGSIESARALHRSRSANTQESHRKQISVRSRDPCGSSAAVKGSTSLRERKGSRGAGGGSFVPVRRPTDSLKNRQQAAAIFLPSFLPSFLLLALRLLLDRHLSKASGNLFTPLILYRKAVTRMCPLLFRVIPSGRCGTRSLPSSIVDSTQVESVASFAREYVARHRFVADICLPKLFAF